MNLGIQTTSYKEVKSPEEAKAELESLGIEVKFGTNWKNQTDRNGHEYVGVSITLKEVKDPVEGLSHFVRFLEGNKTARVYGMIYKDGEHAEIRIMGFDAAGGRIEIGSVETFTENGRLKEPLFGSSEYNRLTKAADDKKDTKVMKSGDRAQGTMTRTNFYTLRTLLGFAAANEEEAGITIEELEAPRPRREVASADRKVPNEKVEEKDSDEIVGDESHDDDKDKDDTETDNVPM